MDFRPSRDQRKAMAAVWGWWNDGRPLKPWFYLGGHAGTGKSSMLRPTLSELGLVDHTPEHPGFITATYTGKAAHVQQKMGVPARTIHSLIYRYVEPDSDEMTEIEARLRDARAMVRRIRGDSKAKAEANIAAMERSLAGMMDPRFILDHLGSDLADCALLVIDEVSMVDRKLAEDLLSFGKPILVMGDPGQLPPVKAGEGYFTAGAPDVMLTEIHRQARDNPIIRLATMAREGLEIPFGTYGPGVAKIARRKAPPSALLRATQVLCSKNNTRRRLNNSMRHAAGMNGSVLPMPGERVIGLRNYMHLGIVNGMFMRVDDVREETVSSFSAKLYDEDGVPVGPPEKGGGAARQLIYRGPFDDHVEYKPDRHNGDWQLKRGLVEADHGRAITVHKAQGSEFDSVIIWYEEMPGGAEINRKLLYTAITRAREKLCICADAA